MPNLVLSSGQQEVVSINRMAGGAKMHEHRHKKVEHLYFFAHKRICQYLFYDFPEYIPLSSNDRIAEKMTMLGQGFVLG